MSYHNTGCVNYIVWTLAISNVASILQIYTCKLVETKPHNYTFLLFTWLPKFAKLRLIRKTNAIVEMTPTNKHTTLLQSRAKAVTKYERPKMKRDA